MRSIRESASEKSTGPVRAAQYVRMSTEHQQYSTENQMDTISRYAEGRNMQTVRTYSDEARSGLNIEGRSGLRDLIHDVESGQADYTEILVYDVSRWGRFQDVDESAYYEYICKRANVRVHYCAEQFENDGSLSSTLLKTIKRTWPANTAASYPSRFSPDSAGLLNMDSGRAARPDMACADS